MQQQHAATAESAADKPASKIMQRHGLAAVSCRSNMKQQQTILETATCSNTFQQQQGILTAKERSSCVVANAMYIKQHPYKACLAG